MRLDRLLYAAGIVGAALGTAPALLPAQQSASAENREQAADQQILHALNRLAFGPRPGDVQKVRAMGLDSWIEQQLAPARIPDTRMDTDLGDKMDDVVILTMSEFGRMARENGNRGTDHGHAGAMFAIGSVVRGGKVHGKWPGLEREQLFEGRDLALTTDFRAVFAEVASGHLGASKLGEVFPGYGERKSEWVGLL